MHNFLLRSIVVSTPLQHPIILLETTHWLFIFNLYFTDSLYSFMEFFLLRFQVVRVFGACRSISCLFFRPNSTSCRLVSVMVSSASFRFRSTQSICKIIPAIILGIQRRAHEVICDTIAAEETHQSSERQFGFV